MGTDVIAGRQRWLWQSGQRGICRFFSLPLSSRRMKVSAQAADPKEEEDREIESRRRSGLSLTGSVTWVIHDV